MRKKTKRKINGRSYQILHGRIHLKFEYKWKQLKWRWSYQYQFTVNNGAQPVCNGQHSALGKSLTNFFLYELISSRNEEVDLVQ